MKHRQEAALIRQQIRQGGIRRQGLKTVNSRFHTAVGIQSRDPVIIPGIGFKAGKRGLFYGRAFFGGQGGGQGYCGRTGGQGPISAVDDRGRGISSARVQVSFDVCFYGSNVHRRDV